MNLSEKYQGGRISLMLDKVASMPWNQGTDENLQSDELFTQTLLHEVLHALGAPHIRDSKSIMASGGDKDYDGLELSVADTKSLAAIEDTSEKCVPIGHQQEPAIKLSEIPD